MSASGLFFDWDKPPRVLVLGDLCLDRYTWGEAERVSPEAPVLVLRADRQEVRLGGAASVASLLKGLGADVLLAAVVGDDTGGQSAIQLLDESGIDHSLVFIDAARPTTTKERLIGRAANRHAHQIVRVDREVHTAIDADLEQRLGEALLSELAAVDAVLISDYGKGVCTPGLLRLLLDRCRERAVDSVVDPARGVDYERYRRATMITPNRLEAALATGDAVDSVEQALYAAARLRDTYELHAAIVTLDCDGMAVAAAGGYAEHFPTQPRAVYDVTGAGDMVLAVLGLGRALHMPLADSMRLANVAAGLEVERMGVSPVSRREIQRAFSIPGRADSTKRLEASELAGAVQYERDRGRTLVFLEGEFGQFGFAQIESLQRAAQQGDVLFVGVHSDAALQQRPLSPASRPTEQERLAAVAAMGCVARVVVVDAEKLDELRHQIRPCVWLGETVPPSDPEALVSAAGSAS